MLEWLGPRPKRRQAMAGFGALWLAAVGYLALAGGDWVFPILAMLIFGIGLSAIAIFLTRKTDAPTVSVAQPQCESVALLVYVLVYAFLFFGPLYSMLNQAVPEGRALETAQVAYKLLVHIVLPTGLLILVGGHVREMWDSGWRRPGILPTFVVLAAILFGLLALVSPSLEQIGALGLSLPAALGWIALSWLWVSIEAGLCEEYLFRAGLQSRLTAWLEAPAMGIAITSVIFALVHAPGLWLRGTEETFGHSADLMEVMAYTVATLSPLAILFGVLWQRTRSLLLVVLLHGSVDALPFTAEIARTWG